MPAIQVGVFVKLKGEFKRHPKHGQQFEVSNFEHEIPKSPKAIEKFLASGAIRGIGASFAQKLVEKFGPETLEVIDKYQSASSKSKG